MRLGDVIGQDHAVTVLRKAVAANRVPHAYLFEGPSGVGKRSTALGLALALVCPRAPGAGCGACEVCRRVEAGIHPDVPLLAPEGAQIVVAQAQAVVALAAGRPHEAPARVVIIDDADRMNASAANSLLKTLEEPAPGTHFILVTAAPDRLLPTIRSRTQRIRFVPVAAAALRALLAARGVEAGRADVAAALADGSVNRALALGEGAPEVALWDAVSTLTRAAGQPAAGPVFDAAGPWGDKEAKESLPAVLALLGRLYRDALVAAAGAPDLVLLRERAADVDAIAAAGTKAVRGALGAIVEAGLALEGNMNAVVAVERMLMDLGSTARP